MDRWHVRASRHLHRDRWISIRADDCVTPSGADISPYYVIEYPDFVHALAIDRDGNVILVDQYRHGLGTASLELPGGMADPSDADPVATALRELAEETGYGGGTARLVATLSVDPAKLANRLHLVLIEDVDRHQAPTPEQTEDIEIRIVPVAEALRLATSGGTVNAAHVGMLLMGLTAAKVATLQPALKVSNEPA